MPQRLSSLTWGLPAACSAYLLLSLRSGGQAAWSRIPPYSKRPARKPRAKRAEATPSVPASILSPNHNRSPTLPHNLPLAVSQAPTPCVISKPALALTLALVP